MYGDSDGDWYFLLCVSHTVLWVLGTYDCHTNFCKRSVGRKNSSSWLKPRRRRTNTYRNNVRQYVKSRHGRERNRNAQNQVMRKRSDCLNYRYKAFLYFPSRVWPNNYHFSSEECRKNTKIVLGHRLKTHTQLLDSSSNISSSST
jgi:hypothetical protein